MENSAATPKKIDGGGSMKKLGVVLLVIAMAIGVMGGGGVLNCLFSGSIR